MKLLPTTILAALALNSSFAAPINEIVNEYIGDRLELAVTPTPQFAQYGDQLYEVGALKLHMPEGDYGAPETIREQLIELLGNGKGQNQVRVLVGDAKRNSRSAEVFKKVSFPKALPADNDEAYQLWIGPDPQQDGILIVLAGKSQVGDFWAMQTLRQLTVEQDGNVYIRGAAISDWPQFPKRGNKRPRIWEHRFKANYAWRYSGDKKQFAAVFRNHGAWIYHPKSIDLADPAWMPDVVANAKKAFDKGAREFVIKYDDAPMSMTDATSTMFDGNYYAAQQKFLSAMFKAIKSWDAQNAVFFMPQPYWTNAFDIKEYGDGLKAAGGLPQGMGLSFCGQEVISTSISLASVRRAQEALGLTGQRAQIYDNQPRGGDFWAYDRRDPRLWEAVECVFPERGTPVTRITVYDYLWNPEAYNPERSLKLACRELAGRNPAAYKALYDYVTTWNRERNAASFMTNKDAKKQLASSTKTLRDKYNVLSPLLKDGALAVESKIADKLLKGENWGESAALIEREEFNEQMINYGYREVSAKRAKSAITVDGALNDAAWKEASTAGGFVRFKGKSPSKEDPNAPIVEDSDQSEVRILYDDTHLYFGITMHHSQPPTMPNWGKKSIGKRANLAWRVSCMEVCIDPEMDRDSFFKMVPNLQNWYFEEHFQGDGHDLGAGGDWHSGLDYKLAVGEKQSIIELRVPIKSMSKELPKPGDRWGIQFCRSHWGDDLKIYSSWSYMFEFYGFRWPVHFGTLIFE